MLYVSLLISTANWCIISLGRVHEYRNGVTHYQHLSYDVIMATPVCLAHWSTLAEQPLVRHRTGYHVTSDVLSNISSIMSFVIHSRRRNGLHCLIVCNR